MSGYTPKRGDRIRISYEGVVTSIDTPTVRLGTRHFTLANASIDLIEAAPVPFVVGQPITPEMGEPPWKSVVVDSDGVAWQKTRASASSWQPAIVNVPSQSFADLAENDGPLTLLRLGDGSVSA